MMGVVVVIYTVLGGIKAVTWTDVQQMMIIFVGAGRRAVSPRCGCCRRASRSSTR